MPADFRASLALVSFITPATTAHRLPMVCKLDYHVCPLIFLFSTPETRPPPLSNAGLTRKNRTARQFPIYRRALSSPRCVPCDSAAPLSTTSTKKQKEKTDKQQETENGEPLGDRMYPLILSVNPPLKCRCFYIAANWIAASAS